ncbi:hypothetical protein VP01_2495g5 [Puccinia sorghi]|uniref:Uncharacterized protein n=1 Tax=Puccinia sorghi TaxID=27349 RepID=A0A0L6V6D8_9BASI|nr:hypothetical protein VP01_2495g5 [Puccinia sorghi]
MRTQFEGATYPGIPTTPQQIETYKMSRDSLTHQMQEWRHESNSSKLWPPGISAGLHLPQSVTGSIHLKCNCTHLQKRKWPQKSHFNSIQDKIYTKKMCIFLLLIKRTKINQNQKIIPQNPVCDFFLLILRGWEQYLILHLQCHKITGASQSQEYGWIAVWAGGKREERLIPGTGEVEKWPILQLHKKVTSGWHTHPVTNPTWFVIVHPDFCSSWMLFSSFFLISMGSRGKLDFSRISFSILFFFNLSLLFFFHLQLGLLGVAIFEARWFKRFFHFEFLFFHSWFERLWVTEYQYYMPNLPIAFKLSLALNPSNSFGVNTNKNKRNLPSSATACEINWAPGAFREQKMSNSMNTLYFSLYLMGLVTLFLGIKLANMLLIFCRLMICCEFLCMEMIQLYKYFNGQSGFFFGPSIDKPRSKRNPDFFDLLDELWVVESRELLELRIGIARGQIFDESRPMRHDILNLFLGYYQSRQISKHVFFNFPIIAFGRNFLIESMCHTLSHPNQTKH